MLKIFGRRQPVKRESINKYLRLMLVSFAFTVIFTRMFLSLTHYPQLGGSNIHIAHVLFGGLFLFAASLLPLVLANRWALTFSSVFSGIGFGLFIDEVGKFITQTNDYFYPPAAPIIYAFFILTVLGYNTLKKEPSEDPRSELYRSLDSLQEILDSDLDSQERRKLLKRLKRVEKKASNSPLSRLAFELRHFVETGSDLVVKQNQGLIDRIKEWITKFETKYIGQKTSKVVILIGLLYLGIDELMDFFVLSRQLVTSPNVGTLINEIIQQGVVVSDRSFPWFVVRIALEAIVGLIFIRSVKLLLEGEDKKAVKYSNFALLVSITAINLFVFYFDQFRAVTETLIQFLLLVIIARYRTVYLGKEAKHAA